MIIGDSFVQIMLKVSILVCLLWTIPNAIEVSRIVVDHSTNDYQALLDVPRIETRIQNATTYSQYNEHANHTTTATSILPPSTIPEKDTKTLSLLFPTGLVGGYRNQAMRFMGLLRHALDENVDNLLLPTLVWSTRYAKSEQQKLDLPINPAVKMWPIPFDELFDVDHWNTFHKSNNDEEAFSLPKLVTLVDDSINNNDDPIDGAVCWKTHTDDSIVSVAALRRSNPDFTESFLPLLTQRMLFSNETATTSTTKIPWRKPFVLDPVQAETMEYLTGEKTALKMHQFNIYGSVQHCTKPYVFGGKSQVLMNQYLNMNRLLNQIDKTQDEQKQAESYTKLMQTVEQALVPAKPWRILADQCVEHHLGFGSNEFTMDEDDPHAMGYQHGYAVLHSRIEPEMLEHWCGQEMEGNLTKILDLVDLLSLDYNSPEGIPDSVQERVIALNYSSPIPDALRKQVHSDPNHRPLKGAMVAVARDELTEMHLEWFPEQVNITRYNRGVLNRQSISYDNDGMYARTLQEMLVPSTPSLPIFECGEGWVRHAFYKNESHQKQLFTPSNDFSKTDYGLYYKYGPRYHKDNDPTFPLLPLPDNYFGDLLPSMMNFWLAVRADIFVGVKKSSWSTHVWTTRYYMGKGATNFEYTRDRGILQIGNGGLPESHKRC